jgi:hypothetical protein
MGTHHFGMVSCDEILSNQRNQELTSAFCRIAKSIGMSIAFYIHSVRSAFASALIGGLMMSRAAYQALIDHKIDMGGLIKDSHGDTMVDEVLSYALAAIGFTFQLMIGFKLPFPLNVVLFPFEFGEWAVRWLVTSSTTIAK